MKQETPKLGTKEFNDSAMEMFGGKPKQLTDLEIAIKLEEIEREETKQETIEEAAKVYAESYRCPATNDNEYCKHDIISAFNNGSKWQSERMYSEEEVIAFGEFIFKHTFVAHSKGVKNLFEQFKNK